MDQKLNILVVEDEAITAESLKVILTNLSYNVIATVFSATQAVDVLLNNKIDLAILDINIQGDKDGIWIGSYINKLYKIPFIFLTAYNDKNTILKATKTEPYGYLLKPFSKEEIMTSIEIALINFSKNKFANTILDKINKNALNENESIVLKKSFFIKHKESFLKLYFQDIYYVDSQKNYVTLFTQKKQFIIRSTLKNMLDLLPHNFLQTHRSYIVNINKIDEISNLNVKLNNYTLPIGKAFKDDLYNKINLIK